MSQRIKPVSLARELEAMTPEELRHHMAVATGIYAHKTNASAANTVLMRIGFALVGGGRA